jgi:HD-like signal output (HDOD) protein
MLVEQKHSLEDWVQFLSREQMPALAETVQKLNRLTTDDDSRVSQLTEQILKDPSLTSRVLQVSNCVMYKGVGGSIKTITRAIVMLGFTTIRDISLSMQILDNILKHNPSHHLMAQIANSFHAAMQARGMLPQSKANQQEEVFISTLLLHFAEMSMLSRDDEVSRKLNYLIEQDQVLPNEAALQVLGCRFDEVSLALAKQWELGDVLLQALARPDVPSVPVQAVLLGDELSQVAPLGWSADPVKAVITKIAKYRNVSFKDAQEDVKQTAALAHEMAVHYGAAKVRHLIPHPDAPADQLESTGASFITGVKKTARPPEKTESIAVPASARPAASPVAEDEGIEDMIELALGGGKAEYPDSATEYARKQGKPKEAVTQGVVNAELQFNIMQEISRLIAEKRMDVNKMLDLVLDGMHTAIGLDRVVMSLTSRDRKSLVPKFFKGEVDLEFKNAFQIRLDEENAFAISVLQSQQLWMGSKLMAGRAYLHTAQLQKSLGYKEYFVAPIIVARKPIGAFYADCAISKRPLNDQQYAGFNMLAQQAGLALSATKM